MQILPQLAEAFDDLHDGAVIVLRVLVLHSRSSCWEQSKIRGMAGQDRQASKQMEKTYETLFSSGRILFQYLYYNPNKSITGDSRDTDTDTT